MIADMGIDGVNTGEDYKNDVRMQMFRDLLMEKKKMATKYIIDQQNEYFNGLIGHINRIIEQKAGEVCGSC